MRSIWPHARLAIMAMMGLGGIPNTAIADAWTFTPRIAGQELVTDNVLLTPTARRSDFVTTLSPGFSITEDGERVQGTLDYSPSLYYYALTPGQNTIGQNLYANGTATVIPDFAFFDVRAFAAMQPTTPGLTTNPIATSPSILSPAFTNLSNGIPATQLSQDFSFSASPYIARRFGDFGAGELRYTFSNTQINGATSTVFAPPGFSPQHNSTDRTNEVTASFNTGERFGPYEGRLLLDAAQSSGTGVLNRASSHVATLDSAYALTPRIAPLLTIGYEKIQFNGFPPTRINDVVWGIGVRLKPSPDATITARYGHSNGITSPSLDLLYNLTARTSLSASYSEGLSTITQQIANNLAVSLLDQDHQPIDSRTLLPLSIVNPILGVQNGLFRSKVFNGTIKTDWERDHIAASIFENDSVVVAQNTAGSGISQQSLGVNFTWGHELTPNRTANLGIGYTTSTFPTSVNSAEDLLAMSASITEALSPTLSGSVGYSFLDRFSNNHLLRLTDNVFYVSLRKEF